MAPSLPLIVSKHAMAVFEGPCRLLLKLLLPGINLVRMNLIALGQIDHRRLRRFSIWFFWGFTGASAKRLAEDAFGIGQAKISVYGNVLSATAFLYGLSFHALREQEMRHFDPDYPVTIGVRAIEASKGPCP